MNQNTVFRTSNTGITLQTLITMFENIKAIDIIRIQSLEFLLCREKAG